MDKQTDDWMVKWLDGFVGMIMNVLEMHVCTCSMDAVKWV